MRDTKIVHCNICVNRYDPVVGHLFLPDAMPTLDAVHLLPRRISNRARCHLLPAAGFSLCVDSGHGLRIGVYAWPSTTSRPPLPSKRSRPAFLRSAANSITRSRQAKARGASTKGFCSSSRTHRRGGRAGNPGRLRGAGKGSDRRGPLRAVCSPELSVAIRNSVRTLKPCTRAHAEMLTPSVTTRLWGQRRAGPRSMRITNLPLGGYQCACLVA